MPAGRKVTVLRPKLYVAILGSVLPAPIDGPLGMDWGADWMWIPYTANGVQMTPANPKVGIPSDEAGDIDQLPAGTENVTWSFQARTPSATLVKWLAGFKKTVHPAQATLDTLTLTGASTGTTVTIGLEGATYNVTVLNGDTAVQVADKIRAAAATFTVHNVGGTPGTAVVTFRQKVAAAPSAGAPSVTGISGTFASTHPNKLPYRKVLTRYNLDPTENNEFMAGIEGSFGNDSFEEVGGLVRAFGYRMQQTENPQIVARKSGADAPLQPVATLRCNPEVVDETQYKPSGLPEIDEYGRYDLITI